MTNYPLRLILADIRSTANVGSILRTAEAFGVERVYAAGYTPYPRLPHDDRPPYIIHSNTKSIARTALGAENYVPIEHIPTSLEAIMRARADGLKIIVLEQAKNSLNLASYRLDGPAALMLGSEVAGVPPKLLSAADDVLEIPMMGRKESFGVAVAAGIALYSLRSSSELSGINT